MKTYGQYCAQNHLRDAYPERGPLTIAIDTPEAPAHVTVRAGEFEIQRGAAVAADVRLSGEVRLIGGYLSGLLSLDEARRGGLHADGDEPALSRLVPATAVRRAGGGTATHD